MAAGRTGHRLLKLSHISVIRQVAVNAAQTFECPRPVENLKSYQRSINDLGNILRLREKTDNHLTGRSSRLQSDNVEARPLLRHAARRAAITIVYRFYRER